MAEFTQKPLRFTPKTEKPSVPISMVGSYRLTLALSCYGRPVYKVVLSQD